MRKLTLAMTALASLGTATASYADRDPFEVRSPPVSPSIVVSPQPIKQDEPKIVRVDYGASRKRAAMWTAVGGLTLWAASGVVSDYAHRRYDRALEGGPDGYVEANRMQHIARVYGTGLFAAGTLALGAAAVLYVTSRDQVHVERRTALVPAVSHDSAGLVLTGGF